MLALFVLLMLSVLWLSIRLITAWKLYPFAIPPTLFGGAVMEDTPVKHTLGVFWYLFGEWGRQLVER